MEVTTMATAVTEQPVTVKQTKLLIGNEWVESASGKVFPTVNPATGKEICFVAEADADDVNRAVACARRAFDEGEWPRLSGAQRGQLLNRLADLIEEHADELARLE